VLTVVLTMREVFRRSGEERLVLEATSAAMNIHRESDGAVGSPQPDEFVLGFRDCANESLRYLEAATTKTASDAREAAETEADGRSLVNALRVHLTEQELEMTRRRRRRRLHDDDDEDKTGRSLGQSSRQLPRHRRRVMHLTPAVSTIRCRRLQHSQPLHGPEDTSRVHLQSRQYSHIRSFNVKVPDAVNTNSGVAGTSDPSVHDTTANAKTDDEVDELRQLASQLSALADRDVRVGLLLTELFQLMDSDD